MQTTARPSFDAENGSLINRTEQYICGKMMVDTVEEARDSNVSQPWIDEAEIRRGFIEDLVHFAITGEQGAYLFPANDWYEQLDRVRGGQEVFSKAVIRLMAEGFFQVEERMARVRGLLLNV